MINRNRIKVSTEVGSLDVNYTSLKGVLNQVQRLIEEYGEDAIIQERTTFYNDSKYLAVFADSLESDDDYNRRIALEEAHEIRIETQEKIEYERLKKKFT